MAAKKKVIDPKGDWKKNSTGGKVLYILGAIYAGTWALNTAKNLGNKA
jgi:hypothetical protein